MPNPVTQAVFLDLDGVLLDSRDAVINLYSDMAREFGLSLVPPEKILENSGMTDAQWIHAIAPQLDAETLRHATRWCETRYALDYLPVYARPAPGAKELLYHLQARRVKKAIVTNQYAGQAVASLKLVGYSDFDAIITADDVQKAKPDPEPLLRALEKTGTQATNALFLGDTAIDLEAGKAAGIRTLLFKQPWNAHIQADKIGQLDDLLVKMYNA